MIRVRKSTHEALVKLAGRLQTITGHIVPIGTLCSAILDVTAEMMQQLTEEELKEYYSEILDDEAKKYR